MTKNKYANIMWQQLKTYIDVETGLHLSEEQLKDYIQIKNVRSKPKFTNYGDYSTAIIDVTVECRRKTQLSIF